MANLKLEHIYKVYPNGTKAVNDISLDIQNGEFIVFVGPSGCGKSTTLRMIAGLEDITAGELYIDSNIVNDVEPKDRDIAMVFQNYALYPHMTVYENMAFGLKLRHVPEDIIQEKVLWASEILGIREYLDRKPRNMSGGQRQRVALGRAILRDPKVMLLDEPLSNLDAKLRTQMRTEIAKLHQKLKTTFIYVTHDQTEAMTLGDRVVVMKNGRIQQVDTPKNLYNYPANKFVAGFIGTPQMNFFPVTLKREKDVVNVHFKDNDNEMRLDYNQLIKVLPEFLDGKHDITFGIRCESIRLATEDEPNTMKVKVSHFEELGSEALIYGNINFSEETIDSTKGQIIIKVREIENLHPEDIIHVAFDMEKAYFFSDETEETILPRIPEYNSFYTQVEKNNLLFCGSVLSLPTILQSPDIEEGELKVPTDAVLLHHEGIKVKVIDIEEIHSERLVHLKLNDRIFFALAKKEDEVSIGDEISVNFDFTRITLINNENKATLFKPIDSYDSFSAGFFNYSTVMATTNDESFKEHRENKIKAASDYMDAKIALENNRYEEKKKALSVSDLDKAKNEATNHYEETKKKNTAEIQKINETTAKELVDLKAKFKSDKAEEKKKNDLLFKDKKEQEEKEYKEFKKNNNDKEALRRRSDEYHMFKDHYQQDKDNTINRILNSLSMDYESKVTSLRSARRRKTDLLKKEIRDARNEALKASNPFKLLEKEHDKTIRKLLKEKEHAISRAGYVFFLKFASDYYVLTSDIISNKLIQGLSTRVFSKDFKVEIPHDGYIINEEKKGFEVMVDIILDYGNIFYVRCSYVDKENNPQFLYIQSEKKMEKGTKLYLSFDLTHSKITETDMNIRLY